MSKHRLYALLVASPLLFSMSAQASWEGVKANTISVFTPGKSSFEWLISNFSHSGGARFQKGRASCGSCHEGDQEKMGRNIVSSGILEDAPILSRRSSTDITLQMRQDADRLYVRLQWPQHKGFVGEKLSEFDSKITLMFDNGANAIFKRAGCWAACHINNSDMPANSGEKLAKYLPASRNKMTKKHGGGKDYKSDAELQALYASGNFLELWQTRLRSNGEASFFDGHLLEQRRYNDNPQISGKAELNGDIWVVEMSRPLAGTALHHELKAGQTYTLGLALHDDFTQERYHQVSLHTTFSLGGSEAEILVE